MLTDCHEEVHGREYVVNELKDFRWSQRSAADWIDAAMSG